MLNRCFPSISLRQSPPIYSNISILNKLFSFLISGLPFKFGFFLSIANHKTIVFSVYDIHCQTSQCIQFFLWFILIASMTSGWWWTGWTYSDNVWFIYTSCIFSAAFKYFFKLFVCGDWKIKGTRRRITYFVSCIQNWSEFHSPFDLPSFRCLFAPKKTSQLLTKQPHK